MDENVYAGMRTAEEEYLDLPLAVVDRHFVFHGPRVGRTISKSLLSARYDSTREASLR
ncbi:MAG: hypothetical protein IPJ30_23450 [Acidobacteria bacterium]|nr:hypothetical protein [Acidobacteriota bacterium]